MLFINNKQKNCRRSLCKILCVLLCISLAGCTLLLALDRQPAMQAAATRTAQDVDQDISDCEALLSRLQSEQSDLIAQLADLKTQSDSAEKQAQLSAGQVALLEAQIDLNESLLQSCDMKRSTAQAELSLVQNEYEYYQELFSELMRFVYENGTVNDFELLFSSESLSDYLERRDNFNSIMECVSDLTSSMEQSLLRLTDLEEEYASVQEKYERYLRELNADKDSLVRAVEAFQQLASELQLDTSLLSENYAGLSATISDAKAKLAELKEERASLNQQNQVTLEPSNPVSGSGFAWPLEKGISYRISSYFSTRTNPITGVGTEFHEGLDIACSAGTQILAAKSGIVTKSAWYGGYGNCVIIYHGQDSQGRAVTTLYGHASALKCEEGQQVSQGDCIALVGTTGRSTGNHLHFSVLLDGVYVDPDDYLPDGYYTKMPNS